jgi:hypothetical protein
MELMSSNSILGVRFDVALMVLTEVLQGNSKRRNKRKNSPIGGDDFAAGAGGEGGEEVGGGVGGETYGAIGKEEVAAAGVQAPEVKGGAGIGGASGAEPVRAIVARQRPADQAGDAAFSNAEVSIGRAP